MTMMRRRRRSESDEADNADNGAAEDDLAANDDIIECNARRRIHACCVFECDFTCATFWDLRAHHLAHHSAAHPRRGKNMTGKRKRETGKRRKTGKTGEEEEEEDAVVKKRRKDDKKSL